MKREHDDAYAHVRMKTSLGPLKRLTACGKYGFFPANTIGDDVELYTNNSRGTMLERFYFLRQQANREGSEPC